MSGTVCCYSGCKKSYSTDKDVFFFKFPDDPKRRKKWMQHCGNLELENLSDRQLRGKRICSDHFAQNSFLRPESRTALNDNAVPVLAKASSAKKAATTAVVSSPAPVPVGRKSKEVNSTTVGKPAAGNKTPQPQSPASTPSRKRKISEKINMRSSPAPSSKEKSESEPQPTSPPSKKALDKEPASAKSKKTTAADTPTAAPDGKTYATRRSKSMQDGADGKVASTPTRQLRGKRRSENVDAKAKESSAPTPPKNKKTAPAPKSPSPVPEKETEEISAEKPSSPVKSPESKTPPSTVPQKEVGGKAKRRKKLPDKPASPTPATAQAEPVPASTPQSPPPPASPTKKAADEKIKSPDASKNKETVSVTPATPTSGRSKKKAGDANTSPAKSKKEMASDAATVPSTPKGKKTTPKSPPVQPPPPPPVVVSVPVPEQTPDRSVAADAISSVVAAVLSTVPQPPATTSPDKAVTTPSPKKRKKPAEKQNPPTAPPQAKETTQSQATPSPTKKVPESIAVKSKVTTDSTANSDKKNEAAADAITSVVNAMIIANAKAAAASASASTVEKGAEETPKPKKRRKPPQKPPAPITPDLTKVKSEPQTTQPQVKKLSMEALMAAVSSAKAPVLSNNTPTAASKVVSSNSGTPRLEALNPQPKPKLVKPIASTPTVEIVREKPGDGGSSMVVVVRQGEGEVDNVSEADSFDEYMYYDREFDYEQEEDTSHTDREFERFYSSLKKCLKLPGKWTMGGVQWDPQGKRKVIVISEPEIPPNGRPCVKRCLQCFEDKSIRVFIDQMDMTDVFGMSCYAEKEDVAGLISRIADASSCCGVPEMVADDLIHFPNVRKRNTSYFDPNCPGVIPNDAYDPICTACKDLQVHLMESREKEKKRLFDRRIRSEEKQFQHPFGEALYSFFNELADETDPSKPRKRRTKETFFRKFLHDTRYKVNGDSARTERVYIEKPISVDSVSQSFQDIVSKLGFNMPNAKKRPSGGLLPRPSPSLSTPRPTSRLFPGSTSNMLKMDRKLSMPVEHILPFTPGSSFTLDDGQEYELIGEVEQAPEFVEMKPTPAAQQQQQFEIIEVDDETLARLASSKNQVVMLPESASASLGLPVTTRIDANDPNLSQILKAINTSHGFKVS